MICKYEECTGCGLCEQICPLSAIDFSMDENGFPVPVIDENKCSKCGKCIKTCPVSNQTLILRKSTNKLYYAASLIDEEEIKNSTSGGVFYALAHKVINKNGIVYGAKLDNDLVVRTEGATNFDELLQLRQSKYLQCVTPKGIFHEIERKLKDGRHVLFSGTPCQVNALRVFLKEEYGNLLLVEVFCSNAVSYLPWNKYNEYVANQYGKELKNFVFRKKVNKENYSNQNLFLGSWKSPMVELLFDDGSVLEQSWEENLWTKGYQLLLMYRECCTSCQFGISSSKNCADISIGDFWGIESSRPELYNEKGTSAVVIHSSKGKNAFDSVSDILRFTEVDENLVRRSNEICFTHIEKNTKRNIFFSALKDGDTSYDESLTEAMGFGRVKLNNTTMAKVGLIGGFNLRSAIQFGTPPFTKTLFHYSNLSLISFCSAPVNGTGDNYSFPENKLRAEMLKLDFEKGIMNRQLYSKLDYIVIDFIEERYDIGEFRNTLITLSDAFCDSGLKPDVVLHRDSEVIESMWKDACLKVISFLKELFKPEQVVLVRNFLALKYVDENEKEYSFMKSDVGFDINRINAILEDYYSFFVDHFKGINVLSPDKTLNLTPKNHKHGRFPSHAGPLYIDDLTSLFLRKLGYID